MKRTAIPLAKSTGKTIDTFSAALGTAGGVLLAFCALVVTYDVIARYIFKAPTTWAFEISILMMLVGVFFTVSNGLKEGGHVHVEVIVNLIPVQAQRIFEIISEIFVLCYAMFFSYYAFIMFQRSLRVSETSDFLGLPLWPIKGAFMAAFIVLALQAMRMLITKCSQFSTEKRSAASNFSVSILLTFILIAAIALGIVVTFKVNATIGLVILLFIILAAGIPISFALCIVSSIGFISLLGFSRGLSVLPQTTYWIWDGFTIMALPLFVFVGHIMYKAGLADDLFRFARAWLGHLPGGLAIATLGACSIFAAISGSSVVNAATIGLVAIPAMISYNYDEKLAAGVVAAGGTLGILIPPSTAMILIGIAADESIGHLFMAGILPGLLLFLLLSIGSMIIIKKTGSYKPLPKISWEERLITTKSAFGTLMLPIIIIGGIYSGAFTPTEAAAIAVTYALGFALFVKKIKWTQLLVIIKESTKTVSMATILLAGGISLGKAVAMLQVTQKIVNYFATAGWPGWLVIVAVMFLVLLLGMFLDGSAICLLAIPVLAPVIRSLGFDMLWFAVLFTMNTEIGLITPPIGMNIFIIQQVSGIQAHRVLRGALPFLIVMVIAILIVAFIPGLCTWLPRTMG